MRIRPDSTAFTLLLSFLVALPSFGIDMSLPALTATGASLGVAPARAGQTMSLFMLGFAVAPLFYGPASDRYGRKPVVLFACTLFIVAGIGCASAQSLPALLGWRVVRGAGAGASLTIALAVIRDLFEGQAARTKLSYVTTVMMIVPMIAPTAGAALLALGGWRVIHGVLAGVGFILLLAMRLGFTESARLDPANRLRRSVIARNYLRVLSHPLCLGYIFVTAGVGFILLLAMLLGFTGSARLDPANRLRPSVIARNYLRVLSAGRWPGSGRHWQAGIGPLSLRDDHDDLLVRRRAQRQVWEPLAPGGGRSMIIDQTDGVDNVHRPYQSQSIRSEPARGTGCPAHGAQRHARRGARRTSPVGHEPQSRPPAPAARRRAPDPGTGRHAPDPPGAGFGRPGADHAGSDHDLVSREETFDPGSAERSFRIGLPDSAEVLSGPPLLAYLCEVAPGVRLRLSSTDRIFDELDADRLDLGFIFGPLPEGGTHHKRRLLGTDEFLCMFNAERVGIVPPISLEDYLRLPHVLSTQRGVVRGVVDLALAPLGLSRRVVLTTPHFVAVPFLVAGAPVVTTMHAKLARLFAGPLGLSLSPLPIKVGDPSVTLVWHASYDHDPAHIWLRRTVMRIAAEVGGWEHKPV